MRTNILAGCAALACILPAAQAPAAAPHPAADVLQTAASATPLAQRSLINGLGAAGQRLVAVGQRGHILYSDDHGRTWQQARVPVSSDLLAVHFPTPQLGWAVGHDGVVLHSADGGASWALQLDGRQAARSMQSFYQQMGDARLAEEGRRNVELGPDKPFLDVWFADSQRGYIVGAFGLLFRTEDGGRHWQPLQHLADNPGGLHLNAIRPVGSVLYVVGEQGLVLRQGAGEERFSALVTPYKGSFFGVVGSGQVVLAFGLRGNAFRSTDGGQHWSKVETGVPAGLTAGTLLPDGRMVLVSQGGHVLASSDQGASFTRLAARPAHAAAVLADGKDGLLIGGARGLRSQVLDK